jgi:hypothetical protein
MSGQKVCRVHGGMAPQALAKAKERLAALVDPAITELGRLMRQSKVDPVRLGCVKDVLDRTGYKAVETVKIETPRNARVLAAVLSLDELMVLREKLQRAAQVVNGPVGELPPASVEAADDTES